MYWKKSVKHLRVSFTRNEQGANWAAVDILFVSCFRRQTTTHSNSTTLTFSICCLLGEYNILLLLLSICNVCILALYYLVFYLYFEQIFKSSSECWAVKDWNYPTTQDSNMTIRASAASASRTPCVPSLVVVSYIKIRRRKLESSIGQRTFK